MCARTHMASHTFVMKHPEERGRIKDLLPEGDLDRIVKDPELLMSLHQRLYYVNYESYKNRKEGEIFLVDGPGHKNIKTITYK